MSLATRGLLAALVAVLVATCSLPAGRAEEARGAAQRQVGVSTVRRLAAPAPASGAPAPSVVAPAAPAKAPPRGAPPHGLVLTPDAAAQLALTQNTSLAIEATHVAGAEAAVAAAEALTGARLSASAFRAVGTATPSLLTLILTGGRTGQLGGHVTYRTEALALDQPLYSGGRSQREIEARRREQEAAGSGRLSVARTVEVTARAGVYDILRSEALVVVAQEQVAGLSAHLQLSKDRLEARQGSQFEVVQAETELCLAQGTLLAAGLEVEQRKANLRQLLALSPDTPLEVSPGPTVEAPTGTDQELLAQAETLRPELRQVQATIAAADARLREAQGLRRSSVDLTGSLIDPKGTFSAPTLQWQVGVVASKPIMDAQAQASAVAGARANLSVAQTQYQELRQDVALELKQLRLNLEDARARLVVAKQGVVNAAERLEIARARYSVQYGAGIEVIDGEAALASARGAETNAEYDLRVAGVRLRAAVGLGLWGSTPSLP